jgi:hypothetical protein
MKIVLAGAGRLGREGCSEQLVHLGVRRPGTYLLSASVRTSETDAPRGPAHSYRNASTGLARATRSE